jgi:hypothetical protein
MIISEWLKRFDNLFIRFVGTALLVMAGLKLLAMELTHLLW